MPLLPRDAFLESITPQTEDEARKLLSQHRNAPDFADWLNPTDDSVRSPLEVACSRDCSTEFLDWLIAQGADISLLSRSEHGRDALVGAVENGHPAKVQYLIDRKFLKRGLYNMRKVLGICQDNLLQSTQDSDAERFEVYAEITTLLLRNGFYQGPSPNLSIR